MSNLRAQITLPTSSPEAEVSQRIGITDITIHYNRPYVKGRKIWGNLVPYGFNYLGFGTAKAAPWRAGSDYNTTIDFSHEVSIQGHKVPAGKYALFIAPEENGEVIIILSSNTSSWGSYYYDEKEDILRFKVTSIDKTTSTEMLTYSFDFVEPTSATVSLHWSTKEIPFKIDVAVDKIVMAGISNDLRNPKGFQQSTWDSAANYAFSIGELDQALQWINASIEGNFFSKETFINLSLKSKILEKQGKTTEAKHILQRAIPLGNPDELYRLGLGFIADGQLDKALEIMQANVKNNDGAFPSHYGLARAFSAKNDFKNALIALEKTGADTPAHFKPRFAKYKAQLKKEEDINPT
ncbi:DUF2911 domain-containing protein [Aquimarina sp. AD10]|uniref:DUF2911 domain-containing protein n=1 Tax=Aquimarina sp. AD10 TaxID=1714849 RepID=UPI000E5224C7|nr:DUF2911 domain-containing protein [Aquimarina sp. AD10]AXT63355.1 DUF2911 domain-containing protein [Aquimarina sp. AD10]RKN00632.1 DUF2911 domain-containing protein [Aquimarina sp. AD10]